MPIKTVFEGKIDSMQILDKDGHADAALDPRLPTDMLGRMYRLLVLGRVWDKKSLALQRTGRMYTFPPLEGQEAICVGATLAAGPGDWLFPTYREASLVYYMRGHPSFRSNLMWMGLEDGLLLDRKIRCFPYATPIATQLPHAVGAAYALRMKGEKAACIAFCGDGATSEGDFHDALNFAGVWNAPCVFIVSNNQWAISVPRSMQTKSETLAQKALAYGIRGVQVDGNDILAVYRAVKEAADSAREGKGPVLIECVTYRMGPHTTADDPKKYRKEDELAHWRERDPIKRMQAYLKGKGAWSEEYEKKLQEEVAAFVEKTVQDAESFRPEPRDIFRFMYAKMPKDLEAQMGECFGGSSGDARMEG
ncbi:pyruvate dehydrogenase (acetyl-transferring) E1 component subunit alpha [Candidatus Micrarchaeota archaeon]|nr:pyruvate dehydrogenase (acetyl-transferring) E1 component subunit alpha [Candidatus Micrarchaeota archaeon]